MATPAARRRQRATPEVVPQPIRAAIYCRQSVTEGATSASLESQRSSAEHLVLSKEAEGWVAVPQRYDDASMSGASTNRPALRRLLADIEAGRVDAVITYKVDRLSRSLVDFVKMLDLFEKHGVRFVSVTQQFDTDTALGKLTLGLLMSFSEFERSLIRERTRDAMVAARRRGRWTGGPPMLGFRFEDRRLVVDEVEAIRVREIYRLYSEIGTLTETAQELSRRGWKTKTWTTKNGKVRGGRPFDRNALYRVLTTPLYIGKQEADGEIVEAEHDAIVDEAVWAAVQTRLETAGPGTRGKATYETGALLRGLLYCSCETMMTPTFTTVGPKRYHYYRCGNPECTTTTVAAHKVERAVVDRIREIGRVPGLIEETVAQARKQLADKRKALRAEVRAIAKERRVAEGTDRAADLDHRAAEIGREIAGIEAQAVDPEAVAEALATFDGIWDALFPAERRRVVEMVIAEIVYGRRSAFDVRLQTEGVGALLGRPGETV